MRISQPPNRHKQRGFIGELLTAGASLIGGVMGGKSQDNANESNQAIAAENNALSDAQFQQTFKQSQSNYESDVSRNKSQFKDLQQRSIEHRVKDAQKAGVHPLYALGASSSGASPAQVSAPLFPNSPGRDRAVVQPNDGMAKGLAGAARAGAGYFARNTPEAKMARAQSALNLLSGKAQIEQTDAITAWYKTRTDGANAQGRDKLATFGLGTESKKPKMIGRKIYDNPDIKGQPHESEKKRIWTKNKQGGHSSREIYTDEGVAGELAPVVNALDPWFEQIGASWKNASFLPPKVRRSLKRRGNERKKNIRAARDAKYEAILKRAGSY
jgi:hypothetical protein